MAAARQFIAPFRRKGVAPKAPEDRGVSSLLSSSDLSSGLRPAPSRSGKQKEGPFMGRLRANFARLGNPMQDCHLRKEPNVTCFPSRPHFATVEMTMCRAPDSRSSIPTPTPTPATPSGAPPIFDPSRSAAARPPRPLPPERSEHNPWHRGPEGPMDAICPSAAKRQAPSGIQPPRRLVFNNR